MRALQLPRLRRVLPLAFLLLVAALPAALPAQGDGSPSSVEAGAPDSPRAAMRQFLQLARAGDYARAARFLELGRTQAARGAELAEQVHVVIARRVLVDLDSISPLAQGDPSDGEPPLQDRVGLMREDGGGFVRPVLLRRVTESGEARWVVAAATVGEFGELFAQLRQSSWVAGWMPAQLMAPGPLEVPRWKWLGVILALPAIALVTLTIGWLLRLVANFVVGRTAARWDDELVTRMRLPIRLFIASLVAAALPLALELEFATAVLVWRVLRGLAVVAVFWALLRAVGLLQDQLASRAWASDHGNARTIVPLVGRSLRVAIALVALLVAISQFGYPVGTVLAGLGIGGLVVALAAQKTVENLFGSVTLAADSVVRVGDWVKVEDVQGTVERIGLRSTHLRTLDRTLVKIPNGRLADLRVESFAERDRIRFFTTLGLARETTAAQLRDVLVGVETLLKAHPQSWPEGIAVRFAALGPQSFDVTVNAWFAMTDYAAFELVRQELLLGILEALERAGARLAVPVQVVRPEAVASTSVPAVTSGDGQRAGH